MLSEELMHRPQGAESSNLDDANPNWCVQNQIIVETIEETNEEENGGIFALKQKRLTPCTNETMDPIDRFAFDDDSFGLQDIPRSTTAPPNMEGARQLQMLVCVCEMERLSRLERSPHCAVFCMGLCAPVP